MNLDAIQKDISMFCKLTGKELTETEKLNMKINILTASYEKEIDALKFQNKRLIKKEKENTEIINKIKELLGVDDI